MEGDVLYVVVVCAGNLGKERLQLVFGCFNRVSCVRQNWIRFELTFKQAIAIVVGIIDTAVLAVVVEFGIAGSLAKEEVVVEISTTDSAMLSPIRKGFGVPF